MARWLQGVMLGGTIPLYAFLGLRALWMFRRDPSPRFRSLLAAFAALTGVVFAGSLIHLGSLAVDAGVLGQGVEGAVLTPIQALAAMSAVAAGTFALRVYRRAKAALQRAEVVLLAAGDRPLNSSASELGLTARELDVLNSILDGNLSDREIAETLFVSPSTAGSHVAAIMHKAGVSSRRQLLTLLPSSGPESGRS